MSGGTLSGNRRAAGDVSRVMKTLLAFAAAAVALTSGVGAQTRTPAFDTVRCSIDNAPDRPCRLTDSAASNGVHRMVFETAGRTLVFVGRQQTGWWAGKLDGRPAMGYERNRGNVVLSTYDLRTTLSWSYPGQAHGTY